MELKLKSQCLTLMILIGTSVTSLPAQAATAPQQVSTVDFVDLDRYLGRWYEIARLPQWFQKGCTAVTADYSRRSDGDIRVINRCRLNNPQGKPKKAVGRAWVVDQQSQAKLKVQFFLRELRLPFVAGKYWILDLDEDYQYAMVGDPERKSLWILARKPQLADVLYRQLVERAQNMGFPVQELQKTQHETGRF